MRREYMSCLGKGCVLEDDNYDGEYSRLDNAAGNTDSVAMTDHRRERPENDYFRAADSYQWNDADNDQGQEPTLIDQGSNTYTGVQIETKKDKKKLGKKTIGKRIRHFFRVSFKWIRRGFVTVSPAITPQIIMNPATVMSSAVGRHLRSNKPTVYL